MAKRLWLTATLKEKNASQVARFTAAAQNTLAHNWKKVTHLIATLLIANIKKCCIKKIIIIDNKITKVRFKRLSNLVNSLFGRCIGYFLFPLVAEMS